MGRRNFAGHPFCTVRFQKNNIRTCHPAGQLLRRQGGQLALLCRDTGHGISPCRPEGRKSGFICGIILPGLPDVGGGAHQHPPAFGGTMPGKGIEQGGFSAAAHQRDYMALFSQKRKLFFRKHQRFSSTAMATCSGVMGSS